MTIEQIKDDILKLVKRNLVLSQEIRTKVVTKLPTLREDQLITIHETLIEADKAQTDALNEILKKEPYFFHKMEHIILMSMEEEFQRQEEVEHKKADETLQSDLNQLS